MLLQCQSKSANRRLGVMAKELGNRLWVRVRWSMNHKSKIHNPWVGSNSESSAETISNMRLNNMVQICDKSPGFWFSENPLENERKAAPVFATARCMYVLQILDGSNWTWHARNCVVFVKGMIGTNLNIVSRWNLLLNWPYRCALAPKPTELANELQMRITLSRCSWIMTAGMCIVITAMAMSVRI